MVVKVEKDNVAGLHECVGSSTSLLVFFTFRVFLPPTLAFPLYYPSESKYASVREDGTRGCLEQQWLFQLWG